MFLKKKKELSRNHPRWRYRHHKPACRRPNISQESREWLISLRQNHRVLICSPLSPSQKECVTNPSKEKKNTTVFANTISGKKSQSLHSQKLPRWAQQIYVTKEKNPYSECYKNVLYVGPKYFDKLKREPGQIRKALSDLQLCTMSNVSF